MKKIKELFKKYKFAICIFLIVSVVVHIPLITDNILTADVLLNTGYYSGYAWEISLGRFGLYFLGLFKGFLVIPNVEFFLSILLLLSSYISLLEIFDIKGKVVQVFLGVLLAVSPIVSATLLFNYCSLAYLLAFFLSICSIYLLVFAKNKIIKYLLPVLFIAIALSMYQAYLAVILTLLLLFDMIQLLRKKFSFKVFFKYLGIVVLGTLLYYLLMKLSLIIFNIDMSSYRGANTFDIKTILEIPGRIKDAYISFYQFYFTDTIVNNTNVWMNVLNIGLFILFLVGIIYNFVKRKISWKKILLFIIFLLILPIMVNVVTILFSDTTMQLLMSSSYLLLFFLIAYLAYDNKILNIFLVIIFCFMIRGYIIQDSSTYQNLAITYQKTYDIASDINDKIKEIGYKKEIMITGSLDQNKYYTRKNKTEISNISNYIYGFVSNYSLFWDEYTNMKNGWSRFMELYLGSSINFISEDKYQEILKTDEFNNMKIYPDEDSVKVINDVIVVKLAN